MPLIMVPRSSTVDEPFSSSWDARVVQHGFAEIALAAVDAVVETGTPDIAVLAAGDIFRRADLDVVGAAERVVISAGVDHGRLAAFEATGEEWGEEECQN